MQNVSPSLVNKDVVSHENKGILGTAGDVIDTATRAGRGLPFVGYAAEKLRGTPLEQVQTGMQRFLSDLPQPSSYRGPLTSQWSPAPRSLAANVPANVPFTQGGGGQTHRRHGASSSVGPDQRFRSRHGFAHREATAPGWPRVGEGTASDVSGREQGKSRPSDRQYEYRSRQN
jgi:hypothetical protein